MVSTEKVPVHFRDTLGDLEFVKTLCSIASHIQARTVPVTGRVLGRAGCPRNAEASPLAKKGRATSVSPRRNAMANPNAPRHWSSKAKTQSLI